MLIFVGIGSLNAQDEKEELPFVEVFGGYSLLRSEGENFNGWKTAVGFTVNRWLAVAVDADGHYFSETTSLGKIKESEYSVTAGPHFSYRNKSKIVPFAYAMAGVGWERSSLAGESESQSGFAFETGGGIGLGGLEKSIDSPYRHRGICGQYRRTHHCKAEVYDRDRVQI